MRYFALFLMLLLCVGVFATVGCKPAAAPTSTDSATPDDTPAVDSPEDTGAPVVETETEVIEVEEPVAEPPAEPAPEKPAVE